MTYGNVVAILLYRVIGRIGMMTLHLEIVDEGSDTGGRTWGHFHDMSVMISCPHDLGGIYVHSFVYMLSDSFGLLFITWGDVIWMW